MTTSRLTRYLRAAGCAVLLAVFGTAAVAQETPRDNITIAVGATFDSLDPIVGMNYPGYYLTQAIFEPLYVRNNVTNEFDPVIAVSHEAENNYTLWRFHLREGVVFSDGSPLTAEDVKFTFDWTMNPDSGTTHRAMTGTIEEIVVIDPLTVEFHMNTADPYFLGKIAQGHGVIVSKAFFEGKSRGELAENPMGSGPYKLGEWSRGQTLTLVPNELYWGEAPAIPNIRFVTIPEPAGRVNALMTGEVDLIDDVQFEDIPRIEAEAGLQVVEIQDGFVHWLSFDLTKPPFNDIELRRAYTHAINLEDTLDAFLGTRYNLLAAPLSPYMAEYNSDLVPHAYDPDLAREILEQHGGSVTLDTFMSNGRYVKDADIYASINYEAQQVGFNVNAQVMEWGQLISQMVNGNAGPVFIIGAGFETRDIVRMYTMLKGMGGWRPGDEFEEIYQRAVAETDLEAATVIWKEMQTYIHENYLLAGIWQTYGIRAASAELAFAPTFSSYMLLTDISWK